VSVAPTSGHTSNTLAAAWAINSSRWASTRVRPPRCSARLAKMTVLPRPVAATTICLRTPRASAAAMRSCVSVW
jgi:hypothetical protein